MLRVTKDLTIWHDNKFVEAKKGDVINVKEAFNVDDNMARWIENKYANKRKDAVRLERKEAGGEGDQPGGGDAGDEIDNMKVPELKAALDEAGVEYDPNAKKADLQALLRGAQ